MRETLCWDFDTSLIWFTVITPMELRLFKGVKVEFIAT